MVGRKSKDLFDTLDLEILETLEKESRPLGILELSKKVKLTHQNLKHHLEKLIKMGLIHSRETLNSSDKSQTNKKIELTVPSSSYYKWWVKDLPEHAREIFEKRTDDFSILMKFLRKAKEWDYSKTETIKEILDGLDKNGLNAPKPKQNKGKESKKK